MAYELGVGGGATVKVNEPERSDFADNLGGAVEFSFVHLVYKVFEIMGNALGSFGAGVAVRFLQVVEPELLDYVEPLIDQITSMEGLPSWLKTYLEKVREGEHEAAALLLGGIGTSVAGAAMSSVTGSLMSPLTFAMNRQLHPMRPDPGTLLAYMWRGKLPPNTLADYMEDQGYADFMFDNAEEVFRPRLGEGGLAEARRRKDLTKTEVQTELMRRGYPTDDAELFAALTYILIPAGEVITAMRRKSITPEEAEDRLHHLGYTDDDTSLLIENSKVIPNLADLVGMAVREAWDDGVAAAYGYDDDFPGEFAEWAEKQGLDREWATRYWRAHWTLPSVTLGYEMMHRRIISEGELEDLLRIADYPSVWRKHMIEAAYTPLTRVDVRRMYGLGVLTEEDVYWSYRDIGYNDENAAKMTQFTVLYVNKDDSDKVSVARELTRSVIEKAYRKGVVDRTEADIRLRDIGYDAEDVELLLSMLDLQVELDEMPDYLEDYRKDIEKVVIGSYTARFIDDGTATSYLLDVGFCETEIGLMLAIADFKYAESVRAKALNIIGEAYVRRAIDYSEAVSRLGRLALPAGQQAQVFSEWDIERDLRTRRLTESQYRKCLKDKLITVDVYAENMRGLGYNEADVALLVGMATGVPEE